MENTLLKAFVCTAIFLSVIGLFMLVGAISEQSNTKSKENARRIDTLECRYDDLQKQIDFMIE